ncbi:MAG: bifunctional UDP-N-acetylmuramoyl-tripeptide:D-alanyl-D-alanine ligase/alanine racemase [Muribaculaceae bacterium]|nr:bifunctional UDP-N-acetylmuramoyl-tripeptide:D-alanyl-D-alanine ligase/alanine racemase [Muribaculaceae bacterium]
MNIQEIGKVLGEKFGENFSQVIKDPSQNINILLTDSRNHFNPKVTLFFAISTPGGNDGHKFIRELYEKGVRNFVVEKYPEDPLSFANANFLIVPDSIDALTEIAKMHRNKSKETLAITGSRGKTTLKEMIFQLLEPSKKISRSPRSFNSKIGVPLSLWQIADDSDLAIIEAGISKKGEMKRLANAIAPDTVIFTNLGDAHDSGFESKEEKAKEKAILAEAEEVKNIIFPADDKLLANVLEPLASKKNIIRWSFTNPQVELFLQWKDNVLYYTWKRREHSFPFTPDKEFDLENIAGALAFLLLEGIDSATIKKQIENLHKIGTRMNVSEGINGCSVIFDSYTSDLSSLLPAIDFMKRRKMPSQTLTLILNDLRHEGTDTAHTYKEIANLLKETNVEKFIGIGKAFKEYQRFFSQKSKFYEDIDSFLKDFSVSDFNDEIILIKGNNKFKKIHEQLEARNHETVLEVNLDAMLRNYNFFRSKLPSETGIIAMVKASGYGAGSYEIAKTLQDAGAAYLAVAALDEGIDLRKNGIVMPVMVMNPRAANYTSLFKNRLEPVIYSLSMLRDLSEAAGKYGKGEYPVHLKLDTGMHRMGFLENEIPQLKELLQKSSHIKVTSIFSHLATADCLDMDNYTLGQLDKFEKMSSDIMAFLPYPTKRHILNSAGIIRFPEYHYDFVRLGIGLYGANTLPPDIEPPLATVNTLRSVIICIREIEPDQAVGYGRKGTIRKKSKIATIPIGYADGMNRKFGNGAIKVLVNGKQAPTIGNICMDATMIDVTGIDCREGDMVEIFGENMSVQALADTLDTIPYEIFTSVSPRVKRVYFRE